MNKNIKLALLWRWSVTLAICCVLTWPIRGYLLVAGAVIVKIIVGLSWLLLMTALGFILLSILCFIFFEPRTWSRWLINWLMAKDKLMPTEKRLLSMYNDERKYFKNCDKLKNATWTAWLLLNTLEEIGGSDATSHIKSLHALLVAKEALKNLRNMGWGGFIIRRHNYDSKEAAEQLTILRQQLHRHDIRSIQLKDLGSNEAEIEKIEEKILQMSAAEIMTWSAWSKFLTKLDKTKNE